MARSGFEGDMAAWSLFVAANRELCICGHRKVHHRGFAEPGCSYAGECVCLRFRLGDAREPEHARAREGASPRF